MKTHKGNICKVFIDATPTIVDATLDEYYNVDVYVEGTKLVKNTGYIIGDYVYIYRGKYRDNKKMRSGIYKKDDEYIVIEHNEKEKLKYHIDNVNELNTRSILDRIESDKESFVQMDDIETINNNSEIYVPTFKPDDDFLKYAVKKVISDKEINLKNYRGKFSNDYTLNNMKGGLNKSTKMTVTNFTKWCEILGCDWELVIKDNGSDPVKPLTEDVIIRSDDF